MTKLGKDLCINKRRVRFRGRSLLSPLGHLDPPNLLGYLWKPDHNLCIMDLKLRLQIMCRVLLHLKLDQVRNYHWRTFCEIVLVVLRHFLECITYWHCMPEDKLHILIVYSEEMILKENWLGFTVLIWTLERFGDIFWDLENLKLFDPFDLLVKMSNFSKLNRFTSFFIFGAKIYIRNFEFSRQNEKNFHLNFRKILCSFIFIFSFLVRKLIFWILEWIFNLCNFEFSRQNEIENHA